VHHSNGARRNLKFWYNITCHINTSSTPQLIVVRSFILKFLGWTRKLRLTNIIKWLP
jgi:hypothetical protein